MAYAAVFEVVYEFACDLACDVACIATPKNAAAKTAAAVATAAPCLGCFVITKSSGPERKILQGGINLIALKINRG
jgi:hypothetical protein